MPPEALHAQPTEFSNRLQVALVLCQTVDPRHDFKVHQANLHRFVSCGRKLGDRKSIRSCEIHATNTTLK